MVVNAPVVGIGNDGKSS